MASDDHERIWLEPMSPDGRYGCEGRLWCHDKVWPENEGDPELTEYVRADIAATEIARLRAELAKVEGELKRKKAECDVWRVEAEDLKALDANAEWVRLDSILSDEIEQREAAEARALAAEKEGDEATSRETLWRDQLRKEEARALAAEARMGEVVKAWRTMVADCRHHLSLYRPGPLADADAFLAALAKDTAHDH